MHQRIPIEPPSDTPEIYCAMSVYFNKKKDVTQIIKELSQIGLHDIKITTPKLGSENCIDIAEIQYAHSWEVTEPLSFLFSKIEPIREGIKRIVDLFHGDVYIEIAVRSHGSNPALEFSGNNMSMIHYFEANISIDLI